MNQKTTVAEHFGPLEHNLWTATAVQAPSHTDQQSVRAWIFQYQEVGTACLPQCDQQGTQKLNHNLEGSSFGTNTRIRAGRPAYRSSIHGTGRYCRPFSIATTVSRSVSVPCTMGIGISSPLRQCKLSMKMNTPPCGSNVKNTFRCTCSASIRLKSGVLKAREQLRTTFITHNLTGIKTHTGIWSAPFA
jgi:hypothetical protein